jgi:hypothetical protein
MVMVPIFVSEMVCKENEFLEVLMIMKGFLGISALLFRCYREQDLLLVLRKSIINQCTMKRKVRVIGEMK